VKLEQNELRHLCSLAIRAAEEAGDFISKSANTNIDINRKENGASLASQVVTAIDLNSQKIILKTLEPTLREYELGLLTEESEDDKSRLNTDYFWCIDPLDGTLPFTEGVPGYAVAIALIAKDGTPIIGVIHDPRTQVTYHALKGDGAFKNNTRWKMCVDDQSKKPLKVMWDRSFLKNERYDEATATTEAVAEALGCPGVEIQTQGGGVMYAMWILDSPSGCYFKYPKKKGGGHIWDFAASACIFNEIGAVATDMRGQPLDLNRPDATIMNHTGILFTDSHEAARIILDC